MKAYGKSMSLFSAGFLTGEIAARIGGPIAYLVIAVGSVIGYGMYLSWFQEK